MHAPPALLKLTPATRPGRLALLPTPPAVALHVKDHVKALGDSPGEKYAGAGVSNPSWIYQTTVLTYRTFLNK
jgi:hypothetical protein